MGHLSVASLVVRGADGGGVGFSGVLNGSGVVAFTFEIASFADVGFEVVSVSVHLVGLD